MGGTARDVQTLTLFVGNNRLQLQQLGAEPEDTVAGTPGDGSMAAADAAAHRHVADDRADAARGDGHVSAKPQNVERFEFQHMVVDPTLSQGPPG
jgi:hypothetical protein